MACKIPHRFLRDMDEELKERVKGYRLLTSGQRHFQEQVGGKDWSGQYRKEHDPSNQPRYQCKFSNATGTLYLSYAS